MAKKKSIIELIAQVESNGDYSPVQGAANPSMSGKYQFDWSQWGNRIMKSTGVKSRQAFIDNPEAQEKWMKEYLPTITKEAKANLATLQRYNPNATLQDAIMIGHHTGFGEKFNNAIASGVSPFDIRDDAGVSNSDYIKKAYNVPTSSKATQKATIYGNNLTPENSSPFATPNGVGIPITQQPDFKYLDIFTNAPMSQNSTSAPVYTMADNQTPKTFASPTTFVGGGIEIPKAPTTPITPGPSNDTTENPKQPWIAGALNGLAPYASNMFAAIQKPAPVPTPRMDSPVTLQRVSMANDRNEVERGVRGANLSFDQSLDAQGAAISKQYTLAQRFNQLSKVNQDERNQNTNIANTETELNRQVQMGNNAKMDMFNREQVERKNAITANNVANVSNATDKFMMQQRDQQMYDLDKEKANYQNMMYAKYLEDLKKANKSNATVQRFGGKLPYSAGKFIKVFK